MISRHRSLDVVLRRSARALWYGFTTAFSSLIPLFRRLRRKRAARDPLTRSSPSVLETAGKLRTLSSFDTFDRERNQISYLTASEMKCELPFRRFRERK